jgi:O-antigen ligase
VRFNKLIPYVGLTGLLFSLAGVLFAPALASIGMILCASAGIRHLNKLSLKGNHYLFIMPILVLWLAGTSMLHGWNPDGGRLLLLKLPLFFFPLLALAIQELTVKQRYWALTVWVWLCYAAAVASLWVYFDDWAWYNQLVLESKPMPVLARMHHIEFSLFLAASVWAGMGLWRIHITSNALVLLRRFTLLAAGVNLVMLHVLSARTGLLAFYAGSGMWLFMANRQHWKGLLTGALALVIMLIAAGLLVPSLRNRLINTMQDLQTVTQKQDPNDKSFAQRWEAWKAAIYLIKEHPATGLGMKELAPAMSVAHDATGSAVFPWNRKMPHNQYLETGIQGGIPAIILLLFWQVLMIIQALRRNAYFLLAMCGMTITAFVFESLLEQQSGVMLCTLLLLLAASCHVHQNKQDEPLHL